MTGHWRTLSFTLSATSAESPARHSTLRVSRRGKDTKAAEAGREKRNARRRNTKAHPRCSRTTHLFYNRSVEYRADALPSMALSVDRLVEYRADALSCFDVT